ncbi:hypothetical protein TrST_g8501 [Triparma strigata]|uniref:Uncharacterized protein n=1 Tax=Triparma strigata TaxID=1606541 RepID=A0A9W7AQV8_9STRA|nr:hypothetical protein TrST_g8501 [Triparma strigata]
MSSSTSLENFNPNHASRSARLSKREGNEKGQVLGARVARPSPGLRQTTNAGRTTPNKKASISSLRAAAATATSNLFSSPPPSCVPPPPPASPSLNSTPKQSNRGGGGLLSRPRSALKSGPVRVKTPSRKSIKTTRRYDDEKGRQVGAKGQPSSALMKATKASVSGQYGGMGGGGGIFKGNLGSYNKKGEGGTPSKSRGSGGVRSKGLRKEKERETAVELEAEKEHSPSSDDVNASCISGITEASGVGGYLPPSLPHHPREKEEDDNCTLGSEASVLPIQLKTANLLPPSGDFILNLELPAGERREKDDDDTVGSLESSLLRAMDNIGDAGEEEENEQLRCEDPLAKKFKDEDTVGTIAGEEGLDMGACRIQGDGDDFSLRCCDPVGREMERVSISPSLGQAGQGLFGGGGGGGGGVCDEEKKCMGEEGGEEEEEEEEEIKGMGVRQLSGDLTTLMNVQGSPSLKRPKAVKLEERLV